MDVVIPVEFQDSYILSTNVPDIEYQAWSDTYVNPDTSTTGYNIGQLVDREFKIYKSVIDENTDDPIGDGVGINATTPTWVLMGYSNARRMYTNGVDTQTTYSGDMAFTMNYAGQVVETFALLNVQGLDGYIEVVDADEGQVYYQEFTVVDIGVTDEWEYCYAPYEENREHVFKGLPAYFGADINVVVNGQSGESKIGRIVAGTSYFVGDTTYGSSVGRKRYRKFTRDGFGNPEVESRRRTKRANFNVDIENFRVDVVQSYFDQIEDTPTLFIGTQGVQGLISSTNIFGFYNDFDISIDYVTYSTCNLQIEGY